MQNSLTPAARVRRQLKAGRPRKILNQQLTALDAVQRITNEADRARGMMLKAGLNPDDIRLALIYCTPMKPGFEQAADYKWLPAPSELGSYLTAFENIAKTDVLLFLGILWFQRDHTAKDDSEKQVAWVTQFLAGPMAEKQLFAARDSFVRGGSKFQDN